MRYVGGEVEPGAKPSLQQVPETGPRRSRRMQAGTGDLFSGLASLRWGGVWDCWRALYDFFNLAPMLCVIQVVESRKVNVQVVNDPLANLRHHTPFMFSGSSSHRRPDRSARRCRSGRSSTSFAVMAPRSSSLIPSSARRPRNRTRARRPAEPRLVTSASRSITTDSGDWAASRRAARPDSSLQIVSKVSLVAIRWPAPRSTRKYSCRGPPLLMRNVCSMLGRTADEVLPFSTNLTPPRAGVEFGAAVSSPWLPAPVIPPRLPAQPQADEQRHARHQQCVNGVDGTTNTSTVAKTMTNALQA